MAHIRLKCLGFDFRGEPSACIICIFNFFHSLNVFYVKYVYLQKKYVRFYFSCLVPVVQDLLNLRLDGVVRQMLQKNVFRYVRLCPTYQHTYVSRQW